jgi:type II secretory pathway component PulF
LEHTPIAEQEASFLEKETDLLAVVTRTNGKITSRGGTALETPIVLVAFALLSTVVVFKVVPQIMGRLVISAMVGVASLCTLSPDVMTNLTCMRDWGTAIAT